MGTDNLKTYIASKNPMRKLFGEPLLCVPTTKHGAKYILNMLDADLSPENLTCDGELSGQSLALKTRALMRARCELVELEKTL